LAKTKDKPKTRPAEFTNKINRVIVGSKFRLN